MKPYLSGEMLDKYAGVLVNFALNSGKGVKPGEVVWCAVPDVAKPILISLHKALLKAKAYPMLKLVPTGINKDFYTLANDQQLSFFPKKYTKAKIDTIDHLISIVADHDVLELKEVDPKKIMRSQEVQKGARKWMMDKEYRGKFTWTTALYGTGSMAREAGLTLSDYWREIIKACFLDSDDPIQKWRQIANEQERIKKELNRLKIVKLHLTAKETDLLIEMGEKRQWVGGGGRNIPSFEIFTSPDWRGTEGKISFSEPLYRYGNVIRGIRLVFNHGKIVESTASQNQSLLKQMINRPNADKIGEFSLTDGRMSNITKFMATTLYDENVGGKWGNTHIAIGMSYKDAYAGEPKLLTTALANKLGFNDSGEHCDMVSTTNRVVEAIFKGGNKKIIFAQGKFLV